MKPLNSKSDGCKPVSSNCVIYQGPDIACLSLCKGDSVSDVTNKLALELCNILDQLDVSVYDLPQTCFPNQTCDPKDFTALLQLIIDKICQANDDIEELRQVEGGGLNCPDCVVAIAECFYYTNEFGDEVTTMQLTDYVNVIGNTVCNISNQIIEISSIVADHENRIDALENAPAPSLSLPQITPTCVTSPGSPTDMNVVLSALEAQFCQLVQTTGSPNNIYQSITKQCQGLNNASALGPSGGLMSTIPGWQTTVNNLASSINNMWLTICDMRAAVNYIQTNCCPSGCDGIEIRMTAALAGNFLTFYITGTIPSTHEECNISGSSFKVTDGLGNGATFTVPVTSYINDPSGFTVDLGLSPLNPGADMEIDADICIEEIATGTRCEFCLKYNLSGQSDCPPVTVIANTETAVNISFTPIIVPASYTIEVWDFSLSTLVQTQTVAVTTSNPVSLTVTGLTPGVNYNLRLVVTVADVDTNCEFQIFSGLPVLCLQPSNLVPAIATPIECPDCGGNIEDFTSLVETDTPGTYNYPEGTRFLVDTAPYIRLWENSPQYLYPFYWYDNQISTVDATALPYSLPVGWNTSSGTKALMINDENSPMVGLSVHGHDNGFVVIDNIGHKQTCSYPGGAASIGVPFNFEYSPETPNRIYFSVPFGTPGLVTNGVYYADYDPVSGLFPSAIDMAKRISATIPTYAGTDHTQDTANKLTYNPVVKKLMVSNHTESYYWFIDLDPASSFYHMETGELYGGTTSVDVLGGLTTELNTHLTGLGATPTGTRWLGTGGENMLAVDGNFWLFREPKIASDGVLRGSQTESNYDNSPTNEGTFAGGTGHAIGDDITLSNGAIVRVRNEAAGVVTEFIVNASGTSGRTIGETLTQSGTSGSGINFSLTLDQLNIIETDPESLADVVIIDGSFDYGEDQSNIGGGFIVGTIDLGNDMNVISSADGTGVIEKGIDSTTAFQSGILGYNPGDGTVGSQRIIFHGAIMKTPTGNGYPTTNDAEMHAYDETGTYLGQFNQTDINGNTNTYSGVTYHAPANNYLLQDKKGGAFNYWLSEDGFRLEQVNQNGFTYVDHPYIMSDVANDTLRILKSTTAIAHSLTYITVSDFTIPCTQGIVEYYIGNAGPHQFDEATSSWVAMCTIGVLFDTPSVGQFTVSGVFSSNVVQAALIYSVDGGISWANLTGNDGLLFDTAANWATGRIYTNPAGSFQVKLSFTTDDTCGKESASVSTP